MPSTPADPTTDRARLAARLPVAAALLVMLGCILLGRTVIPAQAAPTVVAQQATAATEPIPPTSAAGSSGTTGSGTPAEKLPVWKAAVLGVVEGVTEFLPISSTGHLTVTQRLLGIDTSSEESKKAADAYAVVIQAGAILAVVVLYHRRLLSMLNGIIGRDDVGRRLFLALVVGFLPAAVVGFVFEKPIKEHLFGPWPVVAAWIIGGVVLLVLSSSGWWERERHGRDITQMELRDALIIGVAQILALWPGTSRSLVTIVAALLIGLSLASAVEFSFLLGLVTLGAATALDAAKDGKLIVSEYGVVSPLVGFVVAFVAAVVAVRWMVGYLQNHSLAIFGWYRIGVAVFVAGLLIAGVITT